MFGGGVRRGVDARHVRGERAIVNDAPPARLLRLHQPHGFLRAQKRPGEIHAHHGIPLFESDVFHRNDGRAHAGVVEEHIEAAELVSNPREEGADGIGVAHVRRHGEGFAVGQRRGFFECGGAAPGERDSVSGGVQSERGGAADPTTGAGDKRDFWHLEVIPSVLATTLTGLCSFQWRSWWLTK